MSRPRKDPPAPIWRSRWRMLPHLPAFVDEYGAKWEIYTRIGKHPSPTFASFDVWYRGYSMPLQTKFKRAYGQIVIDGLRPQVPFLIGMHYIEPVILTYDPGEK